MPCSDGTPVSHLSRWFTITFDAPCSLVAELSHFNDRLSLVEVGSYSLLGLHSLLTGHIRCAIDTRCEQFAFDAWSPLVGMISHFSGCLSLVVLVSHSMVRESLVANRSHSMSEYHSLPPFRIRYQSFTRCGRITFVACASLVVSVSHSMSPVHSLSFIRLSLVEGDSHSMLGRHSLVYHHYIQ